MVEHLDGDDAQRFIDLNHEVRFQILLIQEERGGQLSFNPLTLPARSWIFSHGGFGGDAFEHCILYATTEPSFLGHWRSHFLTISMSLHYVTVGSRTSGKDNIMAGKLHLKL